MKKFYRLFKKMLGYRYYAADIGCYDQGFVYRFYAKTDKQAWEMAQSAVARFDWSKMPKVSIPGVVTLYEGE